MFQILRFTDLDSDSHSNSDLESYACFIYDPNFDSNLYFDSEYYLNPGAYLVMFHLD